MNDLAIQRSLARPRWPMTAEALRLLIDELSRLRVQVAALADGAGVDDGVVNLPLARSARRLELLAGVLEAAVEVSEPGRAVIGRRATVYEDDGETASYAIVFPGDGDPAQGWISADSPLGTALLGCGPGDRVDVHAPAGRRTVALLSVE